MGYHPELLQQNWLLSQLQGRRSHRTGPTVTQSATAPSTSAQLKEAPATQLQTIPKALNVLCQLGNFVQTNIPYP